jgi:hypothetical protein
METVRPSVFSTSPRPPLSGKTGRLPYRCRGRRGLPIKTIQKTFFGTTTHRKHFLARHETLQLDLRNSKFTQA